MTETLDETTEEPTEETETPEAPEDGEDAEDAEEEEPGEPEAEADADRQEPPTLHDERWWENAWKKSEKLNERHAAAVARIFEEEAQEFVQCPMCLNAPAGWLTGTQFGDEHAALVLTIMGMETPDTFKPLEGMAPCPTCEGRGKVRTGSKVQGYDVILCPDCRKQDASGTPFSTGFRYTSGPNDPPNRASVLGEAAFVAPIPSANGTSDAMPFGAPPEQAAYDPWGRPAGHRHYGIPPADVL